MDQHTNPIYKILEYLESEKSRCKQMLDSNTFYNNETLKTNIKGLDNTIKTTKLNIDKQILLSQINYVSADSFAMKKY
jgi:aconitase B